MAELKAGQIVKVGSLNYLVVGKSFSTAEKLEPGERFLLECETLNQEISPTGETTRITAWVPNFIQPTEEKASSLRQILAKAKKHGVLQVKRQLEKGFEYLPTEPGDPETAGKAERTIWIESKAKISDYPDENKKLRFVAQNHFRGRSVHLDLRFEFKRDDSHYLKGYTVAHQMPDAIKKPVTTLGDGKKLAKENRLWKMSLDTGLIKPRRIRGGVVRRGNLRAFLKASEIPADWLEVEGVTEESDPGEKPPVGATRYYPGVFHILEEGEVEWGAQKPWFQEFFLNGKKWRGRWVFRLLAANKELPLEEWDGFLSDSLYEDLLAYSDASGLEPKEAIMVLRKQREAILGEGVEEEDRRDKAYWVLMQPDDQMPYVLSDEAIEKDWLPPKGVSCLPKAIRKKVPESLRFWEKPRKEALEARSNLAQMEEIGGPGLKKQIQNFVTLPKKVSDFVLQHHWWRGQIVIRFGPSTDHWDLRIKDKNQFWHLVLEENPLSVDDVAAYSKEMKPGCKLTTPEGKEFSPFDLGVGEKIALKPETEENPTKETPAWIETIDAGGIELLEEEKGYRKYDFRGSKLKGAWIFRAEEPEVKEGFWSMSRSPGPETKAEPKIGRRVRWERIQQAQRALDSAQASLEELEDFLAWARYTDMEEENLQTSAFVQKPLTELGRIKSEVISTADGSSRIPMEQGTAEMEKPAS